MSDMKCPVCNCPMKQSTYDYETAEDPETWYCSYMPCDCVCSYGASKAVWEELARTRKALDRAKWWLHEIVENHRHTPISTAEMALKEITALEQKDK